MKIPDPIFKKDLSKISWKKFYEREYGVQYSEAAVSIASYADYHFPVRFVNQVAIPGDGSNTAFYIDENSWTAFLNGLKEYTDDAKKLEGYEKQFFYDGEMYLKTVKKIVSSNLSILSDKDLLKIFLNHQDKRFRYTCFALSAYILNDYIADKATNILESYIVGYKKENERQNIIDALFQPEKRAAALQLQHEVEEMNGKLTPKLFKDLYEKYKWLSCVDIHNKPWTEKEFKNTIKSFKKAENKTRLSFNQIIQELNPDKEDLKYLIVAKRFVYIKDARDDFRRESVFYSGNLYRELAKRMDITQVDLSYLQEAEIIQFLSGKKSISKKVIEQRKNGFVIYLDENNKLVCLTGDDINPALKDFNLLPQENVLKEITGRTASKGKVSGRAIIVKGIKDLRKVKKGDVLIAVTTHPDYVAEMRISAAIVTNEGGITSHAAIVSREYGIPCIVGTKIATKILKDGDIVEVDADNGTVKLLN